MLIHSAMLPRKFLPERDVMLSPVMTTSNVHPLYLPPAVCWLNRTCVQMQHVKRVVLNVFEVISSVLVFSTVFVHLIRLWNTFEWGLLGSLWSLMVCISFTGGCILTHQSWQSRSRCSDPLVTVKTKAGVSFSQKLIVFMLLLATYIYTWLYYDLCSDMEIEDSWIECSGKRGPSLFPVLKWTIFVFVWINTMGFFRLRSKQLNSWHPIRELGSTLSSFPFSTYRANWRRGI